MSENESTLPAVDAVAFASSANAAPQHGQKKGLKAVASRPWKSVKRRFIRSDDGSARSTSFGSPQNQRSTTSLGNEDDTNSSTVTAPSTTKASNVQPRSGSALQSSRHNIAPTTTHGPEFPSVSENSSPSAPRTSQVNDETTNMRTNAFSSTATALSTDEIVAAAEQWLRQGTLIAASLCIGALLHARWAWFVKALEYVGVAWITCVGLRLTAAVYHRKLSNSQSSLWYFPRRRTTTSAIPIPSPAQELRTAASMPQQEAANRQLGDATGNKPQQQSSPRVGRFSPNRGVVDHAHSDTELAVEYYATSASLRETSGKNDDEFKVGLMNLLLEKQRERQKDTDDKSTTAQQASAAARNSLDPAVSSPNALPNKQLPFIQELTLRASEKIGVVHPSLNPFYVVDVTTGQRVFANDLQRPFPIDTDYFHGHMLVLIRTPDVDTPSSSTGSSANDAAVSYFRGKQRRFEFQFQVQLKRVPTGRVYFACELLETIKIGLIQRAFTSAAMAFVKATNANFHCSLSGMPETLDGRWETPHMAFPVEEGMNRVVITPPGEQAPALGNEIPESEESIKQRKKGATISWNTEDTYTFSLWSAYVDFLDWRCLNLPGIRPFNLSNVIGREPIMLTLYELQTDAEEGNHYRCNKTSIMRLEMANAEKSDLGPSARTWISDNPVGFTVLDNDHDHEDEDDKENAEVPVVDGEEDELESADDSNDSADEPHESKDSVEDGKDGIGVTLGESFAEELGEGIYVRSGDAITLREVTNVEFSDVPSSANNSAPCHVTNGGGFAVLQEHTSCVLVIQKVGKSRQRKDASKLIKSGDTVSFKLVETGLRDDSEPLYLTIHRGWWLKWVTVFPKKNGHFTVHTHETEYAGRGRSNETQSAYLTFGGSFWLRHKRWSRYSVGIAKEASVTYGGRMLGLHIPGANPTDYASDEGQLDSLAADHPGKDKAEWMRPLQLQAFEFNAPRPPLPALLATQERSTSETTVAVETLSFSQEKLNMDVPAFVELINRVDRIRQHAFVVRVRPSDVSTACIQMSDAPLLSGDESFIRLRTGRDLANVMRVGLKWRSSLTTPPTLRKMSLAENGSVLRGNAAQATPMVHPQLIAEMPNEEDQFPDVADAMRDEFDAESTDGEWDVESIDELESVNSQDDVVEEENGSSPRRRGKGRMLIGKIAHTVKTTTTATTKKVVSQSVKVGIDAGKATVNAGKATVNAGKAMLPIRLKKPPTKEPKSNRRASIRQRSGGLRVAVGSRSMRRAVLLESHRHDTVLAGELSAPEQSCRTVSSMLSKMSTLSQSSEASGSFSALLSTLVRAQSELDSSFLNGGAVQVGVKVDGKNGTLLFESLVARCLWESHWREEWCGMYKSGLLFYAPFTDIPCLDISYLDIKAVRFLEAGSYNPLAGFPLIVVETAWHCHYCAFADANSRKAFYTKMEELREHANETSAALVRDQELAEARFWQGFQTAIQYSHSLGGVGKWADVASGVKSKSRVVLNNRRMAFDLVPQEHESDVNGFVEILLSTALSFTLGSLKQNPEALIQFLDSTSQLQTFILPDIDREGPRGFCVLANIYHCLLQHALLFSIHGPLHKGSYNHFMRTSCYEIGGDVFSLAELYSCVLRGKMSRPATSKPPYIDAPKKSSAFRYYAVRSTSPKVNFLLNVADRSVPREVPVLNPIDLDTQLETCTASFIRKRVVVDFKKKQVVLPRVFEVYRNDFALDSVNQHGHESLRFCLRYLDDSASTQLQAMLEDPASIMIKYQSPVDQYYSSIKRKATESVVATQLKF